MTARTQAQADRLHAGLFSPAWPEGALANGIVSYSARLVEGLREIGAEVTVMTNSSGQDDPASGVFAARPTPLWARWLRARVNGADGAAAAYHGRRMVRCVRRALRTRRLSVLQVPDTFGAAAWIAPRVGLPLVVRLHGPWFLNGAALGVARDDAWRRRIDAERAGIEAATRVTAPSLDVLEQTRAYYGLPLEDADVVPNPIRLAPEPQRWRAEACERGRLLFVGRIDRHKGADVMLAAFDRLVSAGRDVRLTLVGKDTGFQTRDGRRLSLRGLCDELSLSGAARDRLETPGRCVGRELAERRRAAEVVVVPSRYETFGNTALEALAMGCPLVASRAGGLAEIVTHERDGLLVEPDDAAALAEAVGRLLDDPALAAELGVRGLDTAARRHSPAEIARQTLEGYRRAMEAGRRWISGGAA